MRELKRIMGDEIKIVKSETEKNMRSLIVGQSATKSATVGRVTFKKGQEIDEALIAKMSIKDLAKVPVKGG